MFVTISYKPQIEKKKSTHGTLPEERNSGEWKNRNVP